MDDKELMKISKDIEITPSEIKAAVNNSNKTIDDKTSIITEDRLRKFNQINGIDNNGVAGKEVGEEEGEEGE